MNQPLNGRRVLVVEDESLVAMLLENRLGRDRNLMLQDSGGNDDNPNGGDGGKKDDERDRPAHRLVMQKKKKRAGQTSSGPEKTKVKEDSDSEMSDENFQIVKRHVNARTSSKGFGSRPAPARRAPDVRRMCAATSARVSPAGRSRAS